jgi:hypothetical protein
MLTHAAAGLPLPDDVGMAPAHYSAHVEARRSDNTGYTLLRLGPYTQTWLASRDADRMNNPGRARHRPSEELRALARHLCRREHMSDTIQAIAGLLSHQQTADLNLARQT